MLTDKNISWNKLAAFSLCGLLFSLPLSIVAVEIFSGLFVIFSILSLSIFKINLDRINLVVFLIIFFYIISAAISGGNKSSLHAVSQSMWLLFIPTTSAFAFSKEVHWFQKWFIFGQSTNSIIGVGEYAGFLNIDTYNQGHIGLVPFHIWSSMMLALAILFLINDLFSGNKLFKPIYNVPIVIFLSWELFSTSGRTGQAVLIIAAIILVLARSQKTSKMKKLTFLIILFIISMAIIFPQSRSIWEKAFVETFKAVKNESYITSVGLRLDYLYAGFKMFIKHPLFGIGVGQFKSEFYFLVSKGEIPYVPKSFAGVVGPTNIYLQYISEMGIIGISLLCSLFYFIYNKFKSAVDDLRWIIFLSLIWMMIGGLGDVTLATWCLVIPFAIFTATSTNDPIVTFNE